MAIILLLHPQRSDKPLALERDGDTLIVNGERFDFTELPKEAVLPPSAISSPFFTGPVRRDRDHLYINMLLPLSEASAESSRYPRCIHADVDGPVTLPKGVCEA